MSLARNLRRATVLGGGATNDPLAVGWTHAWWTGGAAYLAEGYSAGDNVTLWPDEVGTLDLDNDAGKTTFPKHRTSVTALGGLEAVQGSGASTERFRANPGSPVTIAQPFTFVVVGHLASGDPNFATFIDRGDGGSAAYGILQHNGSVWRFDTGASNSTTALTSDADPHLFVGYADDQATTPGVDATRLFVDGVEGDPSQQTGGAWPGNMTFFRDRADNSITRSQAHLLFVGVYDGDARDDAEWAQFIAWVEDDVGLPQP